MNTFRRENMEHIRSIFQEKTGVELTGRKTVRHPVRTAVILAAALACCLTATAFAVRLFPILDGLRPYFDNISYDTENRRTMAAEYMEDVEELFQQVDGHIVSSVSPGLLIGDPEPGVIFDETVPPDEQYLLISEHYLQTDWDFKLLAAEQESALVLSVSAPLKGQPGFDVDIPIFYIFTYEKAEIGSDADCAFLYGRMLGFSELEQYKVYEDEQYVCYEVSSLIYPGLRQLVERADIQLEDSAWERLENVYAYYQENMGDMFYYRS